MSRRKRIIKDGGTYLVQSIVNEEKNLLKPYSIKKLLLKVIYEAKFIKKYRFKIKNILIKDNNVQIIIKMEKGESLSKIMQWILSVFAMRYNRSHNRKGHLWIARFISKVLHKITEAVEKLCNEGMNKRKSDYRFSFHMLIRDKFFRKLLSS